MSNKVTVTQSSVTLSNYPAGWQNLQYRWTLATELIRACDLVRTLAASGRLTDLDEAYRACATRDWDRHVSRPGRRTLAGSDTGTLARRG